MNSADGIAKLAINVFKLSLKYHMKEVFVPMRLFLKFALLLTTFVLIGQKHATW